MEKGNITDTDYKEMPEYSLPMPPLSIADRKSVIKKCREQLAGSRAKYAALKYSFNSLQQKEAGLYNTSLAKKSKNILNNLKQVLLCLAEKKEKDTRSLLTKERNALEKIDIRKNNFFLI